MTSDEMFDRLKKPQEEREPLFPCARFDEQVHLQRFCNRRRVMTLCGEAGLAKLHALYFQLPREDVDCPRCRTLAAI